MNEYEDFLGELDQGIRVMRDIRLIIGVDFKDWNVD